MTRLHRKNPIPVVDWTEQLQHAFADYEAFRAKAQAFEQLDIESTQRKAGFSTYAPEVLKSRKFPALWGKTKPELQKMSFDKCAYCEGEINADRSGQVEHFRPKSLFPTYAYEWSNYFLACGGCNGAKSDKWQAPDVYLKPDQDDPDQFLSFAEDGTVQAAHAAARAVGTIEDWTLNRKPLVRRRRRQLTAMLSQMDVLALLAATHPEVVRAQWKDITAPDVLYLGALKQCGERAWAKKKTGLNLTPP